MWKSIEYPPEQCRVQNVIEKLKEKTGIQYTRMQFKNKWSKLKAEYNCWKTLLKEMGLG
jgi:hypothetical protein